MDDIYTTEETAQYLKLSVAKLNQWRVRGGGPKFVKLGGSIRYRQADIIDFVNGTSEFVKEAASA